MAKLTFAEKIAQMPDETIAKWTEQEMAQNLRKLRQSLSRRLSSFHRKNLVSQAEIQYVANRPEPKDIASMTRNQMYLELSQIRSFFQAKTSTEKGIREVNRQQDISIFGADTRGRPRKSMSNEERTRFWSLYDEYENMYKGINTRYSSSSVQQMLGQILFDRDEDEADVVMMLDRLEKRLAEEKRVIIKPIQEVANVYTGQGNDFRR